MTTPATQHVAAKTVERTGKTVLNDTKAIIEASTGVQRAAPAVQSRLPYKGSEDDEYTGLGVITSYPCYSPMGGVTFRIERYNGNPALWVDATLAEAKAVLKDMAEVIDELEKADLPEDGEKATPKSESKPSWKSSGGREYVPLKWIVDEFDPKRDDVGRKGQTPVINNKVDTPVVWFKDEETALDIVGRLNERNSF